MAPQQPPAAFGVDGGLPAWKPNPSSSDPTFDMGFLKAAFDGDLRLVKKATRVLGRGAEGRRLADKLGAVRDGNGIGLLHSAALGGSLTVCRYLVEDIRLDVNDAGPMGHVEIVELLLSKGANPDGLSNGGTALHVAAKNGHDDIVKVLLDHHADKAMLASAKSKAHEAFKNGNYLVAAGIYKEAMKLDPCNATLRSNSSLCWIRFGNGMEALKDAQACRMMRPGWAKACYREGTALMLLKDYEKACGAFLDGLKLEPGNAEMEEGLR